MDETKDSKLTLLESVGYLSLLSMDAGLFSQFLHLMSSR